ncbi:MAG: SUMF1/EgtB/PvdO family nonheme iron enzyme [Myxococcota bacterium]|nr:SUMF1/EgtB/PvdO family nonheme iron enzyme [Myxococcota bacterium]MBP8970944.1 SUMF1/EgtB/PvdO family nonheme iron enzyme [Myxococcota bacterium]HHW97476.1 SUMF1/EgtB/PvdO family nonheme iron enzyme [Oligoflexales bacterium]
MWSKQSTSDVWVQGRGRVWRGGSWTNAASRLRSAFRDRDGPSVRGGYLGIRLARTVP